MRKLWYFLGGMLISIIVIFSLGSITPTNLTPYPMGWAVNATSTDASLCEVLKAAPGVGYHHYIEQLSINCGSDITVTIGGGEDANAVVNILLGPITFKAAGTNFVEWTFLRPLEVKDNNSITVDASGAGAVQIFMAGKTW